MLNASSRPIRCFQLRLRHAPVQQRPRAREHDLRQAADRDRARRRLVEPPVGGEMRVAFSSSAVDRRQVPLRLVEDRGDRGPHLVAARPERPGDGAEGELRVTRLVADGPAGEVTRAPRLTRPRARTPAAAQAARSAR
jgi:hypothetical protein